LPILLCLSVPEEECLRVDLLELLSVHSVTAAREKRFRFKLVWFARVFFPYYGGVQAARLF